MGKIIKKLGTIRKGKGTGRGDKEKEKGKENFNLTEFESAFAHPSLKLPPSSAFVKTSADFGGQVGGLRQTGPKYFRSDFDRISEDWGIRVWRLRGLKKSFLGNGYDARFVFRLGLSFFTPVALTVTVP